MTQTYFINVKKGSYWFLEISEKKVAQSNLSSIVRGYTQLNQLNISASRLMQI